MNIKDFFSQKETSPEAYWALTIEPGIVQAGIWFIKDQKTEVLDISPVTSWEDEGELSGACDAALSSCIQKLPEEMEEPTKTVFGVASSWVSGGEIKEEFLNNIKNICSELSLVPSGFVVLPEAISHFYKSQEGVPLNAIVVGLRNQELEVSIFKTGNLVGTTQVARSVSLVDDCIEGLTRFEAASPLPSRIIVYDGKGGELEEAKNSLSGHSWADNEKVKFLHTPQVEMLESDKKVTATALAGGTEIGGVSELLTKEEGIKTTPLVKENIADNLGFVISEVKTPPTAPTASTLPIPNTVPVPRKDYIKGVKHFFRSLYTKLYTKSTTLLIVLAILGLGIFAFWWFYPKATVTIYVSPKSFEEEFEIAFNPGEAVEVLVSGDKTENTTGIKLIGEKAKGSVQVRNGMAAPINLSAGTILLSAGDLRFSFDNSASVSAALSPGSPGTTTTQVTAGGIGAEYNLAKDENFKIANYPKAEVDGVATTDFSGGSSKEISAVSESDQKKLKDELEAELIEKAKVELSGKAGEDQLFVNDLASLEEQDETYSHKIGDEADSVKLALSVNAKGIITDKIKLAQTVQEKIKDKIPQGFILRDTQISYEFKFDKEDSAGNFIYQVTAKVNFLPEINQDEIRRQILGRLPEVVESYLTSVPGFSRADIRLKPRFPGKFGTLPRVKKNITIEIASE